MDSDLFPHEGVYPHSALSMSLSGIFESRLELSDDGDSGTDTQLQHETILRSRASIVQFFTQELNHSNAEDGSDEDVIDNMGEIKEANAAREGTPDIHPRNIASSNVALGTPNHPRLERNDSNVSVFSNKSNCSESDFSNGRNALEHSSDTLNSKAGHNDSHSSHAGTLYGDEELLLLEGDELPYAKVSGRRFGMFDSHRSTNGVLWSNGINVRISTGTASHPNHATYAAYLPKNGTGLPMIYPGPQHINVVPSAPESFHDGGARLMSQMIIQDARRLQSPHMLLNRIVFDCIDQSPTECAGESEQATRSLSGSESQISHVESTHDLLNGDMWNIQSPRRASYAQSLKPFYTLLSRSDSTLVFESRFESGNLRRAIQVYDTEYDLILQFDINTRGHTQWFYFSVSNMRRGVKYKFNIINLLKPDSLYNSGMKPLVYSEYEARHNGRGWVHDGTDICYYQNNIKRNKRGQFYTFTWSYVFEHENDTVYFAYCYPYTYTNLQNYLSNLEKDPVRRKLFRRRILCQTLAGNNCDLLTITSFSGDPQAMMNRKGVVFTARVHPGESNSSWMMKGIIDYLTGPSLDAKILRDNFVFKIVPMLNPDGVINGNYRCSLAGCDLNRRWSEPSRKLHPTIYHTKQMIRRFAADRELVMFCDLHGHSRKKNIFIYGCANKNDPQSRIDARVFPRLLWKNSPSFSFQDCSFSVQRSKESTARVVMFRELNIPNSFTLEASFCGSDFGRHANVHYNTRHLEQMGHYLCESILDYCDPDQSRVRQVVEELYLLFPDLDELSDGWDTGGSDGSISDDDFEGKGRGRGKKKKKKAKRILRRKKRKQQLQVDYKLSNVNDQPARDAVRAAKTKPSSADDTGTRVQRNTFDTSLKAPLIRAQSSPNVLAANSTLHEQDVPSSEVYDQKQKERKRRKKRKEGTRRRRYGKSAAHQDKNRKEETRNPISNKNVKEMAPPEFAGNDWTSTLSVSRVMTRTTRRSAVQTIDTVVLKQQVSLQQRRTYSSKEKHTADVKRGSAASDPVCRRGSGGNFDMSNDENSATTDDDEFRMGYSSHMSPVPPSYQSNTGGPLRITQGGRIVQALVPSVYRADIALQLRTDAPPAPPAPPPSRYRVQTPRRKENSSHVLPQIQHVPLLKLPSGVHSKRSKSS